LVFSPPDGLTPADLIVGGPVMISPNGKQVAFVATGRDGKQLLWVRPLESLSAEALPGTDGASYPFWSADSQFVGFFAQRKLRKIDVSGGPPQTLCDAVLPRGGTWNSGGRSSSPRAPIRCFSVCHRRRCHTVARGRREPGTCWPSFLPDGRHYVYFGRPQNRGIFLGSIDSAPAKLLLSEYVGAAYAAPGYLVGLLPPSRGAAAGTLLAHRFDVTRLEPVGQPVPVAERIQYESGQARGAFSVSENGTRIRNEGSSITQLVVRSSRQRTRDGGWVGGLRSAGALARRENARR
jgi:hypothetical protein